MSSGRKDSPEEQQLRRKTVPSLTESASDSYHDDGVLLLCGAVGLGRTLGNLPRTKGAGGCASEAFPEPEMAARRRRRRKQQQLLCGVYASPSLSLRSTLRLQRCPFRLEVRGDPRGGI